MLRSRDGLWADEIRQSRPAEETDCGHTQLSIFIVASDAFEQNGPLA